MDRGNDGCEESAEGQPGRPLQALAVGPALDETPTELGDRHITHGDDVAGLLGQRSDRPQRGASGQVDDPVEAVRNQLACRGGDILGGSLCCQAPPGVGWASRTTYSMPRRRRW